MDTHELIKLYLEIGLLGALGLFFMWVLYELVIFIKTLGHKKLLTNHAEAMDRRDEITPTVEQILQETRLEAGNADCCFTMELHNGTNNFGGLPFAFMTNYYEKVSGKWLSHKASRQSMPLSLYYSLVKRIKEQEYLIVNVDEQDDNIEDIVYATLKNRMIHRAIYAKMLNSEGIMMGFLGLDYGKDKTEMMRAEDLAENVKICIAAANKLGLLLSLEITDVKSRKMVFDRKDKEGK